MKNRFMQARNVKNGQIFVFNGVKYKYEMLCSAFRQLRYANDEVVAPKDIPTELLLGKVEVEVTDD